MPLVKRSAPLPDVGSEAGPSFDALIAELQDSNAAKRRGAARALGEFPSAATDLCRALEAEALETVREAIFTSLIRIASKDVAAGLVPYLHSEDVGLRNGATEALKTMPEAVAEQMEEIFGAETDVRIFGVEILGALAHPAGPRWLARVIESDPSINVCAAAVDALAECGDRESIAPLRKLLKRFPNEPFLEFSVRTALARIANA